MSKVSLRNLHKRFGEVTAVDNFNLEIQEGEFFSLLGPSGCGKTTTLRMIAGFEFPTSGQTFFDDRDVTFTKPDKRNTGMVFQNFALFPHMTVFENVAFGLEARKVSKPEIQQRVGKALAMVELEGLASRGATELSGGQQQRVALARAIVIEPDILLLDEPLSNLDAKLREETRAEIKALQTRLKITTIYVTHDQDEALSLSDRIAVLKNGVCQQVGTPFEIYRNPQNAFVADFVGKSNVLSARVGDTKNTAELTNGWVLKITGEISDQATISLRPEHLKFTDKKSGENIFTGKIQDIFYNGSLVEYQLNVFGQLLVAKRLTESSDFERKTGDQVSLFVAAEHVQVLPQ